MKRRKRTNSTTPAKGRLRDMADQLWSLAVREDWGHVCAICGADRCEAHHLIPRQCEATRYDLRNGIALCSFHHKFCPHHSPHQNAAGFISWLETYRPLVAEWYFENRSPTFDGTKTAAYYCDQIRALQPYVPEDGFRRIVGVRFAERLLDKDRTS